MITVAACLEGPRRIVLKERKIVLEDDEVLVRTHKASICGTDKNEFLGLLAPQKSYPMEVYGHEGCGIVEAVGAKVTKFAVGDKVMNFWQRGTFSHHWKASENHLFIAPEGLDMDLAALGEPAGCAIYSVFHSGVQLGDVVAVVGLGFAGQIMVQGAKKKGASIVIGIDPLEGKRKLAKQLGADVVLDPEREDVRLTIDKLTGGKGVDVAFEAAGNQDSLNLTSRILRANGTIALYSWHTQPVTIDISRWHHEAFQIRTTCMMHLNPPHERDIWIHRVLKPIRDGLINIRPLLTHEFRLESIQDAFEEAVSNPAAVKVVIKP